LNCADQVEGGIRLVWGSFAETEGMNLFHVGQT
jgi:hypothetical protein